MNRLDIASDQLDRILAFFSRIEAKASFVFAVNSTILALIALNLRLEDFSDWKIAIPALLTILGIVASICFVYRCSFPNLDGGHQSLFYFAQIAQRREADYIESFLRADQKNITEDLLGQVWQNAEILTYKFIAIKKAFALTALSLIPLCLFLLATAVTHSQMLIIK